MNGRYGLGARPKLCREAARLAAEPFILPQYLSQADGTNALKSKKGSAGTGCIGGALPSGRASQFIFVLLRNGGACGML